MSCAPFTWKIIACGLIACLASDVRGEQTDSASTKLTVQEADAARDSRRVIELTEEWLQEVPPRTEAYYWRGREYLRRGDAAAAVHEFDLYIAAHPEAASQAWERGIACYYAGQFAEGAKQFSAYQTFDKTDVENAVWHFLCVARLQNWEQAQQQLLPVHDDPRVPMLEIYRLFAGTGTPDQVLAAAEVGSLDRQLLRKFYAHLYLGLYFAARDDKAQAIAHLERADQHVHGHYMWDIAHLHLQRLKASTAGASGPSPKGR